jgi:hypothetical protein
MLLKESGPRKQTKLAEFFLNRFYLSSSRLLKLLHQLLYL